MAPTPSDGHTHGQSDAAAGVRPPDSEPPGKGPPDKSQRALAGEAYSSDPRSNLSGRDLAPGTTYLLKEVRSDAAYRIFRNSLDANMPCLIVTRQYPEHVRRERCLMDVRIFWLSRTLGEDHFNPTDLDSLAKVLRRFIEDQNGESVILLDGLEYLLINNGFPRTLEFVEQVNEVISQCHGIVLLPVIPDTLQEKELALLERNTTVLDPEDFLEHRANVVIIPLSDAPLPACERLQRELEPVVAVVDQRPDEAERKIAEALRDGVAFVVLVEEWAGKDGTYRVMQPDQPMARMTLAELKSAADSKS